MAGSGDKKWSKRLRLVVRAIALLIALVAVWYAINRFASPKAAVSLYELPGDPSTTPNTSPQSLKLATFNIAHGRGTNESNFSPAAERHARLEKIARLLRDEKVDIAVLQEVDFDAIWTGHEDEAMLIAKAAGFKYLLEQRNFDVAIPFARLR